MIGKEVELVAAPADADEMEPYERLLGDAMRGDATLFTREDTVEAEWRVVESILGDATPVHLLEPGTGGLAEAERIVSGCWHKPVLSRHKTLLKRHDRTRQRPRGSGVNPFNQPDVEASKLAVRMLTDAYQKAGASRQESPFYQDGAVMLFADEKHFSQDQAAATHKTPNAHLRAHFARKPVDASRGHSRRRRCRNDVSASR